MIVSAEQAHLTVRSPLRRPRGAVLVLHGGSEASTSPGRRYDPAVLRLVPVAWTIYRHCRRTAVYRLRFAIRGWNHDGTAALRDGRWALARIRSDHPGVPIVLVGHSMGARVAARLVGEADVAGAVLLTPWLPAGDPVSQTTCRPLIVVQGGADRTCPEPGTREWLARAGQAGAQIDRTVLPRLGHTMTERFWVWHRLAWRGVATILRGRRPSTAGTAGTAGTGTPAPEAVPRSH